MNKLLLLLSVCACLVACNNRYTLNGTVTEGTSIGDSVYLQYIEDGRIYTLNREAVKDSSFSFKGSYSEPRLCHIVSVINGKPRSKVELFVEPGDISVIIGEKHSKVSGTFLNTRLQEYKDSIFLINQMFNNFYEKSKRKKLSVKGAEEADKGMKVLSVVREEYLARFIEKNIDNPVCNYIITKDYEYLDPEKGLKYISRMPLENKSDTTIKHIEHTFRNKILTAVGNKFLDFDAISNDGKPVKLSDFAGKGKVTILNIWSTTGRNVQNNVAEFKALADAYKDKAEFVSFAIEKDITAWNNAIKKHEMWWNNISDMQGWNSKAIFSYGVNSFPYHIIFDANGTILHKGINIKNVHSILEEATK